MITLWGRSSSANVQKVAWLSEELGLEVDRKDVGGPFGGLDTPEYIAMNPCQLIPTIQDGETTASGSGGPGSHDFYVHPYPAGGPGCV